MNKTNEKEIPYEVYNRSVTLEESINVIKHQDHEIARLKSELASVKRERDKLLTEVSKLKVELELVDGLKKFYFIRSDQERNSSCCMNGLMNDSKDCNHDCEDDDDVNDDIDLAEDLNDNYKSVNITDPYQYQWCRTTPNNNTIRNNASDMMNYSRSPAMNYELSQDLLDKKIELLERKYGGIRAREAAIVIQRAFRRYTLIKKFTHITEMAKAEKVIQRRRYQGDANHPTAGVAMVESGDGGGGGSVGGSSNVHDFGCEMKQTISTPIRSMSMREKRLIELENGGTAVTNSLPRSYTGRCTSCAYCTAAAAAAVVVNSCSPCCLTASTVNACPNYYTKPGHSGSIEIHSVSSHVANCNSLSPMTAAAAAAYATNNYQTPNGQRKYSGQYIYHSPQYQMGLCSVSQYSTPKKVPPEVPKRTSSISFKSNDSNSDISFEQTNYSGSLSSVQSSSSDSSSTMNASHTSSLNASNHSSSGTSWNKKPQVTETVRKRQYRVGLNLFNKKPEKGVVYLVKKGFLEDTPPAVAKFLIARKGLSKEMIGEYLGNIRDPFNAEVLQLFVNEIDLSGMQIDVALRKYQTYFKMPGEAQKIERLMQVFSDRYCRCNRDVVSRFRSSDTVFILSFAIIMLNTDLHNKSLKDEKRMKLEEFIKNSSDAVDYDIDRDILVGIYERVKANEFKPGNDHVSQVMKVQSTIVGKKLNLALPHRRLVCYCRLYEIQDVNKKERLGVHQREVFLFNDLLVVTKILSKKKESVTYTFKQSFALSGLHVSVFQTQYYQYGIHLSQRVDSQVLIRFHARNDHDRTKFVEDIRESIMEMDEMENIRIEGELERQKSGRTTRCNSGGSNAENRDSGVADVEIFQCIHSTCSQSPTISSTAGSVDHEMKNDSHTNLKRSALSNSLLDIHDQDERPQRSGSVGSLDSGMSISFQSGHHRQTNVRNRSSNASAAAIAAARLTNLKTAAAAAAPARNQPFLTNLFAKSVVR